MAENSQSVTLNDKAGKNGIIPEKAQEEVLKTLTDQLYISKKDLVEIGQRNGMKGDQDKLQRSFISRQMQRFLADLKDDEGHRLVMAVEDRYVVLDACNSRKALQSIHNRLQHQMRGLEQTDLKVQSRIESLKRMIARLTRRGGTA